LECKLNFALHSCMIGVMYVVQSSDAAQSITAMYGSYKDDSYGVSLGGESTHL
jgi:hypothetical protein